ncbi:mucin-5AC-like isoform X2 [Notolabrus celidotus]|uniref:mucin-5AC-like isoform X2 n=1 Tax=Notolabrus celidotus TaxID=1203425 RepID=UPI0014904AFE|nr:mucin-5AC-like isoform X2 [Notolabrus celidotus]
MELPLGGPALRHYTQSRPRPHRQKLNYRPNRPQETIIESENEVLEHMGRVDEGVEEFFTKRVLPTDTLKKQDEETITVHEVAPASSVPCPPQTKTLRRKLGDFFTLKKRRGLKSETSHEGRPKKTSIADLIRPLREVARAEKDKDKERVKEHDKENEKEKAKENPSANAGESADQETPVSGAPPLRGEAVPPRRALREGKSQSLILLSGSAASGTPYGRNTGKKQLEGQHSFEQKLHLMLQRIGVSKPQPGETQNQEGEMKKAESEGTIIDSKPEPPPTLSKPRTMSASSDTRHQMRSSVSAHESAGKPALLPKPVIKPGPPPTTSGRNTPENELAQIQEAETNTPTKLSPATSTPATPVITATTTTPTVPTISNSVPDSTSCTVSPSSTAPPSDADTCIDSVNGPTAATTPTNETEVDSKPSIPEANAITPETPTSTGTAAPTEPPTSVSVTSTSSESITSTISTTSSSVIITTPSISTSEAVSAPSNEIQVSTASTDLLVTSNALSVDATPAAGDDAAVSVSDTAASPSTCAIDTASGLSTNINVITAPSDELASVTSASCVNLASSVTTTSPPPDSADSIATPVSPDAPVFSSSTLTSPDLPPATTTNNIISPTSPDCTESSFISTVTQPATFSPAGTSIPSTSSSETNPTDTTTTTTTSIDCSDSTSTTNSATAAAISSPPTTDLDPPYSDSVSTTLTPTISDLPTTDNSSAASPNLTSPAPAKDSVGQEKDLKTSPEHRAGVEPAERETDEELEATQESKETEAEKSEKVVDGGKKSEDETEKEALVNSEVKSEEVQDAGVKPGEDSMKTEVGTAEPASRKDADEVQKEGEKQEETQPVGEK